MASNNLEPNDNLTYLAPSSNSSSNNLNETVTLGGAYPGGFHPATVAGASIGVIIGVIIVLLVLVFLVAYFGFPQKLLKWIMNLHLKVAGLRRKSVISATDGFEFHYTERGRPSETTDNPSLLLIHGFSDSVTAWSGLVQQIPSDIHCVAVDLPGHGRSEVRERDDLTLTGFTNKVHEFVVTIGLNKVPAGIHVMGHSLGGAIAGNYGAHFGKKDGIKLVTLACPAMQTPKNSEFWEAVQAGEFEQWLIPKTPESTKLMLSRTMNIEEKQLERGQQLIKGLSIMREKRNENYRRVWKSMEPEIVNSKSIVATWAANECPSQIVWGSDDRIIDRSGAELLAKVLPDSQMDILEDHGHSINIECPKELADVIVKFRESKRKGLEAAAIKNGEKEDFKDRLLDRSDSDDLV